jgi:hypothetical protein
MKRLERVIDGAITFYIGCLISPIAALVISVEIFSQTLKTKWN